jgi:hypothetical protein
MEAVDVRTEPMSRAGETGYLPEIGDQLFDLLLEPVDVATWHRRNRTQKRVSTLDVGWPS